MLKEVRKLFGSHNRVRTSSRPLSSWPLASSESALFQEIHCIWTVWKWWNSDLRRDRSSFRQRCRTSAEFIGEKSTFRGAHKAIFRGVHFGDSTTVAIEMHCPPPLHFGESSSTTPRGTWSTIQTPEKLFFQHSEHNFRAFRRSEFIRIASKSVLCPF